MELRQQWINGNFWGISPLKDVFIDLSRHMHELKAKNVLKYIFRFRQCNGFPRANFKSFELLQKIYKVFTINHISWKYNQYFFFKNSDS